MSKIGKQPVRVPSDIAVSIESDFIHFKNEKGEIKTPVFDGIKVSLEEGNQLVFSLIKKNKQTKSSWGTARSLAFNAVEGLTKGFEKVLILEGVGYRITKDGNDLTLNLGFSHPVKYRAVPGIVFEIEKNSILKIKGVDKIAVGQVAAEIRSLKKPEPYKGKGFRYNNEIIRRKAGKKAATAGS